MSSMKRTGSNSFENTRNFNRIMRGKKMLTDSDSKNLTRMDGRTLLDSIVCQKCQRVYRAVNYLIYPSNADAWLIQYRVLLHIQNRLQDLEELLVLKQQSQTCEEWTQEFSEELPRNIATQKVQKQRLDLIRWLISEAILLICIAPLVAVQQAQSLSEVGWERWKLTGDCNRERRWKFDRWSFVSLVTRTVRSTVW